MLNIFLYVLLGLVAGVMSGLLGIGGGLIIVPALVFMFGLSQHAAQGTTLALMIPPIGLLAAWAYYKGGHVDVKMAAFICLGFFFGGYLGAKFAEAIPDIVLRKLFGTMLLIVALKLIFQK